MIRPAIHARRKLIFLYLLRTSSALATSEPPLHSHSNKHSSSSQQPSLSGHIALRIASRTDVAAIQRCNLATLPENYSSNFYVNHLRQWPDLALVAEHVMPSSDGSGKAKAKRNPFDSYDPNKAQTEIIGYVLGKVEETAVTLPASRVGESEDIFGQGDGSSYFSSKRNTEMMGHVTSLAVLPTYRRRGLAAKLMKQLHYHMDVGHSADGVGLHVRVSNVAARRLYCEGMGYGVVDVIRGYYQDGEDAFFMRKNFMKKNITGSSAGVGADNARNNGGLSRFSLSRMRRRTSNAGQVHPDVYENGLDEYRLPQIIPLADEVHVSPSSTMSKGAANQHGVNGVVQQTKRGLRDDSSSHGGSHVMTGRI